MFDSAELKGKWREVKGEITKKWGQLSDDDLEKTKGNFSSLVGLVEQKLGLKKEEVSNHLSQIADKYKNEAKSAGKGMADKANQTIDQQKNKMKNS